MKTKYICHTCNQTIQQRTVYCCDDCAYTAKKEKEKIKRAVQKKKKILRKNFEYQIRQRNIPVSLTMGTVTPEQYAEMCRLSEERNK